MMMMAWIVWMILVAVVLGSDNCQSFCHCCHDFRAKMSCPRALCPRALFM